VLPERDAAFLALDLECRRETRVARGAPRDEVRAAQRTARRPLGLEVLEVAGDVPARREERHPVAECPPPLFLDPVPLRLRHRRTSTGSPAPGRRPGALDGAARP